MQQVRYLSAAMCLLWSADAAAISPLALSCQGCHQPSVDARQMPSLRKMSAGDIAGYLRQSRQTPQAGSIMARFTSKLSDAEIDALAAELAAKPR